MKHTHKEHVSIHIFYTSHLPVKLLCDIRQQQVVFSSISEINANASQSPCAFFFFSDETVKSTLIGDLYVKHKVLAQLKRKGCTGLTERDKVIHEFTLTKKQHRRCFKVTCNVIHTAYEKQGRQS